MRKALLLINLMLGSLNVFGMQENHLEKELDRKRKFSLNENEKSCSNKRSCNTKTNENTPDSQSLGIQKNLLMEQISQMWKIIQYIDLQEHDKKSKKINTLNILLHKANKEIDNLNQKLQNQTNLKEVDRLNNLLNKLNIELEKKDEEISVLKSLLQEKYKTIKKTNEYANEITDLREQLKDKDTTSLTLLTLLHEQKIQNNYQNFELSNKNKEISNLKVSLHKCKNEINNLQKQLKEKTTIEQSNSQKIETLYLLLNEQDTTNDFLNNKNSYLLTELEYQEKTLTEYKDKISNLQKQLEEKK